MNAVIPTGNQLALVPRAAQRARAVEQRTQYLAFMPGGRVFAVGILAIKEIIENDSLTMVPMKPESIRRVISLPEAVVPVMVWRHPSAGSGDEQAHLHRHRRDRSRWRAPGHR